MYKIYYWFVAWLWWHPVLWNKIHITYPPDSTTPGVPFIFQYITDCYLTDFMYLIKKIRFCTIIALTIFCQWEVLWLTKLQSDEFLNLIFLGGVHHRYTIIDYCRNSGPILFIWSYNLPDFDIKWNPKSGYWRNRTSEIRAEIKRIRLLYYQQIFSDVRASFLPAA